MKVSHSDVIILLGLLGEKCRYQTQTCFGYLYQIGDVKVYLKHSLIGCDPLSNAAVVVRWEALDPIGSLPSASYDHFLDLPAYEKGLEPLHIQTNKINLEGLYLILDLYKTIEDLKKEQK
jgi:hypothetical protein